MKQTRLSVMLWVILFAATLILGAIQPVQAAGDLCFGLSKDDCALAQDANSAAARKKITSFNQDFELTATIAGTVQRDMDLSVKGSGPFEFDTQGIDFTSLRTPGKFVNRLSQQDTMSGSFTYNGTKYEGNLESRIVNGVLYFQGDKLTSGQWRSIELTKLVERLATRADQKKPAAPTINVIDDLRAIEALTKVPAIPGFIKAERGTDQTIEGQTIATFIYHIDLPTLFNSPDFTPILKVALEQLGEKPSNDQLKAIAQNLETMFKGSTVTITRLVGTTDRLPRGFGLDLALTFANSANTPSAANAATPAATAAATASADASGKPVTVNVHFLVKLSGIGTKVSVTAPVGATPVDLTATTK